MKKYITLLSIPFIFASCSSGIEGEGTANQEKEFAVDLFTTIDAKCNCDITLIPSEENKVVVESHQNLIDNLEIKSSGSDLVIKEKENVAKYSLYNVNIYINPNLEEIELYNQSKLKISGTLKSDKIKIETNDQSKIEQSFLEIKDLKLSLSDQTFTNLSGTVINLDLKATDQSKAELQNLQTVEIDFNAQDNTTLTLYAMKDLSGTASDNAQVSYKGDPNKDTTEKDRALINQIQ